MSRICLDIHGRVFSVAKECSLVVGRRGKIIHFRLQAILMIALKSHCHLNIHHHHFDANDVNLRPKCTSPRATRKYHR
jgi:hypothetical protein